MTKTPPVDWARALRANPRLAQHERQQLMFWLRARGWQRVAPLHPADTQVWFDPAYDIEATFEQARLDQAARDAQHLLEPLGWRAYACRRGVNTKALWWWRFTRVRRRSVRCTILEALEREARSPKATVR